MGQYYKAYVREQDGTAEVFCPQTAIYMTRNGLGSTDEIKSRSYDYEDPNSWGSCFSGLKLMEHSWMENDFVNGVMERIWDNPCRVAWVGDYADASYDFNDLYTNETYMDVWGDGEIPESPFPKVPERHLDGFLVDHTKGTYIDLAKYDKVSRFKPDWGNGMWCIHPLPILTAIGNGRGCGDYCGTNMRQVGAWAMDLISFQEPRPDGMTEVLYYSSMSFVEGDECDEADGLRKLQQDFESYMTTNRWDTCCTEGIYEDDGIRAVSMFLEFVETGRVTDDDGRELVQ